MSINIRNVKISEYSSYINKYKAELNKDKNIPQEIKDNFMLICSICAYYVTPIISFDDLLQTAIISSLRALKSFSVNKGKLSTFLFKCVKNDIIRYLNENGSKTGNKVYIIKQDSFLNCSSLDSNLEIKDENNAFEIEYKKQDDKYKITELLKYLNKKQKYIIREHYLKGREMKEIAEELGNSRQAIQQLKDKALLILKNKTKQK